MSLQSFGWAAAFFCLVLLACGSENPTDHNGGGVPVVRKASAIVQISNADQPGRVGAELDHPLEVRITDSEGVGVENRPVIWTVASGEGVLDDLWTDCPWHPDQPPIGLGDPLTTTTVRTDAEGIARVRFTPTWFGVSTITAGFTPAWFGVKTITADAADFTSTLTFTVDATDPDASLEIISENDEDGLAATSSNLPLTAQVTDGEGNEVPYVRVSWSTESGEGRLTILEYACPESSYDELFVTRTQTGRVTYANFLPVEAGTHQITASVAGLEKASMTFEAHAAKTVMVISLSRDPWHNLPTQFWGPNTVPIGTSVEFWNREPEARITSTSAPPNGASFDSGQLGADDRFRFIPEVAGTWEFVDQISGAAGTLTAVGMSDSVVTGYGMSSGISNP